MKQIPIGFPPELEDYAKKKAALNHESMAAFIRRLILDDKRRSEATINESATA